MFVKSAMIPKHKCYVVQENDTVEKALDVLEHHQIDGVPVLSGDQYAGVVTRYNIYQHFFSSEKLKADFVKETLVKDIVTHHDKYLVGDEMFEKTLLELQDFPILSVVDEESRFLGLVTRYDILEQFQSAFGMHREGIRIAFTSVETEGRIARLGEIIQQHHESVISLVTFDATDKLLRRIVLKIEKKDNIDKFLKKLEKSGFRILDITED
ncbi:CBS domain-containing protein [Rossellomorea vietnamensis]|uniref:CBS domain-containing protein n=1 Tax=Rossellomorea vietnamensis TaxID=218284 RepID=A0A5D4NZI7_9BACI|nr:CBS domain-containing protein [Rossellomorea vietnamensis]TYS18968.1 CBS domain-containing protein [Rossellomorea vietnamensis]